MSAANALLRVFHTRLAADAALMALTAGRPPVDRLAGRGPLPLIVFGEMDSRDYSTSTEEAQEHLFSLTVWSEAEGRREAEAIAARLRALLHDAALSLEDAVLVSLMHTATRTRREAKTGRFSAELSFRAVTE